MLLSNLLVPYCSCTAPYKFLVMMVVVMIMIEVSWGLSSWFRLDRRPTGL